MKTILVPVDFSPASNNACQYALRLAKLANAKLILFHSFETPIVYSDVQVVATQVDYDLYRLGAERDLNNYYSEISGLAENVSIEKVLMEGLASSKIRETAIEKKADLIVMGTTGKGAVERILVGSNATRLVKEAPCLVLLVPPDAVVQDITKMVYATDLSEDNLQHAAAIIPFAKILNAELLFLNIHMHENKLAEDNIHDMEDKIKHYVNYPKLSGFFCHDKDTQNGIRYFINEHHASCLAMYTRHRGLIKDMFNPSLTGKMAVHTHVPLLVTHEFESGVK